MFRPALVSQPGLLVGSALFMALAVAHAEPVDAGRATAEAHAEPVDAPRATTEAPSATAPEALSSTAPEMAWPPSAAAQSAPPPAAALIGGWQFLASAGFGTSTSDARRLELSPYGATLGLDVGYTFRFGFRLGAYGGYSFGRSIAQSKDPLIGRPIDFVATASSVNGGLSLGWDVPVHLVVLRYSIGAGVTSMKWDFGSVDPGQLGWDGVSNPVLGFHVAPSVALLWPHGLFEGGIGLDYLMQTNYALPNGFIGKLVGGVRL
jgi:hypothetical protein